MEVVIFILVIVALIVVHEFGHFVVAKLCGMRVDEFGVGYPPRLWRIAKVGETEYTLNWLPFGGFVKIFGEELDAKESDARAFNRKNRFLQALVLVAGIAMNLLFAYILITGALIAGTPRALTDQEVGRATHEQLAIANVLPGSPAAQAGLQPGDTILSAEDGHVAFTGYDPIAFTKFVANGGGNTTIALSVRHPDNKEVTLFARPATGIIASDPTRAALGVEVATIGVIPVSFWGALGQGAWLTWEITKETAFGLFHFFASIFTFSANLSQVSGPIGIAGAVGGAAASGLGNLLSLMAVISINLALINLIPIPALDGGRLLFVIIEAVIRRPIPSRVAYAVNAAGFAFLILLMVIVSLHDIYKIIV